jgi:hypothetical protein
MLAVQFDSAGEDGGVLRYKTEAFFIKMVFRRENVVQQQRNYRHIDVCDIPYRNRVKIFIRKFDVKWFCCS